ncbi:ATP-binding protein [Vibrio sp. T187]|uniref:ATP-binding protein n=1 Tax=Vibrio TaxID=662 RepID=UPI0010C95F30|nr:MULTISPECIES: ATP-binding protein [Vibrio]MBW3697964.1 ATP-binding protein [Vibrio sp. T187]
MSEKENPNVIKSHFKANAGVKDIVGRGLIYNDNVAIIELVKNSKDAGSPSVHIEFNNIKPKPKDNNDSSLPVEITTNNIDSPLSEIIIKDSGKGMSLDDIKDKWLNIAYSEKKNKFKKAYAGNKGVGRFSCDRLGKRLELYTKSSEDTYYSLIIDWTRFENKGKNDEISSVPLVINKINEDEFLEHAVDAGIKTGTILKIKELRSEWNEKKLNNLISELEKFSPSLEHGFEIFTSSNEKFDSLGVKKKVNNGILDKLEFKTTYIKSKIENGLLETSLYYQGQLIYSYEVENPYVELVKVDVEIHYLDTISKGFFTKKIGFNPNAYGSIFLYYNGFRISPYGNEKNDWLNLDQRKSQGVSRHLGTRDLFGKINVTDSEDRFNVITSREGLAFDAAFLDLVAYDHEEKTTLKNGIKEYGYVSSIVRQLESFVVDGLDWNRLVDRLGEKKTVSYIDTDREPERFVIKELSSKKIEQAINKIAPNSYKIEKDNFYINDELIKDIKKVNDNKFNSYIDNFIELLSEETVADLPNKEKPKVKEVIKHLQHQRDIAKLETQQAERLVDEVTKEVIIAKDKLSLENKRSSLLEGMVDPAKTLDGLITHVIQQISGGIEKDARSVLKAYYEDPSFVTKEDLIEVLEHAVVDISTIKETASIASKAAFNIKVSSVKQDLFAYMEDYINKVASKDGRWGINIKFINEGGFTHEAVFNPAEASVLFVNLIDNARKAGAKEFVVMCNNKLLSFIDDGVGFDFERLEPQDYMKKGITTTVEGSGLGLYHCAIIAKKIKSKLEISNNDSNGSRITLRFN